MLNDTVPPVDIYVFGLTVSIPSKIQAPKSILQNINLHVPAGSIVALMGASGSGKTSLLNEISGRGRANASAVKFTTTLPEDLNLISYVQQIDTLSPFLTVRKLLGYIGRLRLPSSMTRNVKDDYVERVILALQLKEAADTIVGDVWQKGISGGEKRRVSVAIQLLSNPSVICLDEPTTGMQKVNPTSGLDSFNAICLVEILVSLARSGRTIVCSIHQPSAEIFNLFDSVYLLAKGQLVYGGTVCGVIDYFQSQNLLIPQFQNPADWIVDITSIEDDESLPRVQKLIEEWAGNEGTLLIPPHHRIVKASSHSTGASFLQQIVILSQRQFFNLLNDRLMLYGSLFESIFIAIFLGIVFLQLPESVEGLLSRKAVLVLASSVCFLPM
jgi:ABC-type multidrug transport system ATPase subunit